ncbi:MAG: hypothetical protein J6S67_16665 [Methanobrevibacter sp.]|nr:hypothetical protein [Methanobrevibacter sp.]
MERKKYLVKYNTYSRIFNEYYVATTTTFHPENYNNIVEMWEIKGSRNNMTLLRRIK